MRVFLIAASYLTSLVSAVAEKPNVIVLISDDAGYADWGFMDDYLQTLNPGQAPSPVPTPNLDALRARGVLCTNAYTAPVCSPSRAAIVTGSYQNRIGYEFNINNLTSPTAQDGLVPEAVTIFDRMKEAGYTTGAIGKWHLGARDDSAGLGNRPEYKGVDEFHGIWRGSRNYEVGAETVTRALRSTIREPFSDTVLETSAPWNVDANPSSSARPDLNAYITNGFGEGALQFIDRHYEDEDPFFLYVAFTAPHSPIGASPDIDDPRLAGLSGTRKNYASMVLTMDKEIGLLMDKIADPAGDGSVDLSEETYFIFINDNGGASGIGTVNTPLNGWKGSVYEGGTRVPFLMAGPGIPAQSTFHHPIHSIDILPTCLGAAEAPLPGGMDGVNLLPYFRGERTSAPHETITIRSGEKASLRHGDWKLVKASASSNFALYNLAHDIREANNLINEEPEIASSLIRHLTAFEAKNDKPRHAGLSDEPDSINLNDRFVFAPQPSNDLIFTSEETLVGGSLRNGDFNASSGLSTKSFEDTPEWFNAESTSQTTVATRTDLTFDGSRNAVIAESPGRGFGLDTGHTLEGGENFRVQYVWADASNWSDNLDRIRVSLFTTSDDTATGERTLIQGLDSQLSRSNSDYQEESALFSPIPASAAGKRLFVLIDSAQLGSGFARLDNFVLERGSVEADLTEATTLWNKPGAWMDPDTNAPDTLLTSDFFANCVLDFPARESFSYAAQNNLTRLTGLPAMVNRIDLSGEFAGDTPQSLRVNGAPLFLVNDLTNQPPTIGLTTTGADFEARLELPLEVYGDLLITGDGDAQFTLAGAVTEFEPLRGLRKEGSATLTVETAPQLTGTTTLAGGTLLVADGVNWEHSKIHVEEGATLGGGGTISSALSGNGTLSPGASIGTLTVANDLAPGRLLLEVDGADSDLLQVTGTLDLAQSKLVLSDLGQGFTEAAYPLIAYGSLSGEFQSVEGLPAGYELNYAYQTANDAPVVALVAVSNSPYETWIQEAGVSEALADFSADASGDGVPNGIAFFLGAPHPFTPLTDFLPLVDRENEGGRLIYRYRKAQPLPEIVQHSSDLLSWHEAVAGENGVSREVSPDHYGPDIDEIRFFFPETLIEDEPLFLRLQVTP
ncbi:sulfatase-like hydrolase/transferase [Roseibacillus ishigakijimensis]|uniref:Sulfatase-like hydrolase/transferase n=1 Tax=Roseibacillus ishigakijimensis TaxID=454146 RepID=A0A934RN64_9BACT|nr:sulfatase-like hydrolase/transferase [Roseibacillus ishigakijimensis]MBK1833860.1 sulfatase-like hydrolase/transferase [Roseibacillus ishigakijimensis]